MESPFAGILPGWTGVVTNFEKLTEPGFFPGDPERLISMKLYITLSDGTKITQEVKSGDFKVGDKVESDGLKVYKVKEDNT